jgi:hypothetical protein
MPGICVGAFLIFLQKWIDSSHNLCSRLGGIFGSPTFISDASSTFRWLFTCRRSLLFVFIDFFFVVSQVHFTNSWVFVDVCLCVWISVVGLPIFGSKFPPRSLEPSVVVFTLLGVWMWMLFWCQTLAPYWSFRAGASHLVVECGLEFKVETGFPQKKD